jgi:hypothetical protein
MTGISPTNIMILVYNHGFGKIKSLEVFKYARVANGLVAVGGNLPLFILTLPTLCYSVSLACEHSCASCWFRDAEVRMTVPLAALLCESSFQTVPTLLAR